MERSERTIGNLNDYLAELANAVFVHWLEDYADVEDFASLTGGDGYRTLAELCLKVTDGSHSSPKEDPNGEYPMFSVKDMERFGFSRSSCKMICREDFETMIANDCVPKVNDVLVAKDGSYLKEIFLTDEEREEAVLSSIAIFRPNAEVIEPEILLQYLKHPRILKLVGDNFVSGSALPRIVLKDFKKLLLFVPSKDAQQIVLPILKGIRRQIRVNVEESEWLSELRDALLPKLMSGEIDVSKVDLTQLNNHLSDC